ncbi:NAD(P)/FAD-dependent oxidoreductase [Trujillonella endophytica]|uniref:Dehydrogenase (Flavoprotein) n=1 Tax=Trujillonella endophytica TaxID=673521 RepID=A0A1H8Q082_9ACTN|nr:NAD(P)/FAD-dependent oxidoreductase [Trujillella endophytica]SEO47476.1 Dehydrogenase (flavoprotein) [Trujillella endophytica]
MDDGYDAIVVGARCAGSPTAMLLARSGHRVLLVDRATFPSDTVSTLMIHAPGVAALRRWGLLDAVTASGCPPIDRYTFDFGAFTIAGTPRPCEGGSTAYAPRRTHLDRVLVEAAVAAGAELRERVTVEDVLRDDDGAVAGIVGHGPGGRPVRERARVVIGADGRSSRVARAVGAEEYMDRPRLMWSAYTYWTGLPVDAFGTVARPGRGWASLPTSDGLTLVVVGWPYAEAAAVKADLERHYLDSFELAPAFAERVRAATRVDRFSGAAVPNTFRATGGPGWALVGDAGYVKDPITAQGISDALRDAELCAAAVDQGLRGEASLADALGRYQFERDTRSLPMYGFTTGLATLEPPAPEVAQLLAAVSRDQAAMDDFVSMTAGTLSPEEFFSPEHIGPILSAAGRG